VLCDIDHTLCASWRRDDMIGVNSWDEYHADAQHDEDVFAICELVRCLYLCLHQVVGLTSRPEKWRTLTVAWLVKYDVPLDDLLMRAEEDYRQSPELKLAMARAYVDGDLSKIGLLIEDREDVITAFRAEGVTCIQALGGRR
jgi:hypothetical protein